MYEIFNFLVKKLSRPSLGILIHMTKLLQRGTLLFYTALAAPATSGLSVMNNSVPSLDCTESLRLKKIFKISESNH